MTCFILSVVVTLPLVAARFFLARMPNAAHIPCINTEPGCHGQPTCESFGHHDCFPGRPINAFGYLYKLDPTGLWSLDKCLADSDGDGWSNGDEMGDPCCVWQYGEEPPVHVGISSPSHAVSTPPRRSCGNASVEGMNTISSLTVTPGPTSVFVSWDVSFPLSSPLASCTCGFVVTLSSPTDSSFHVSYLARSTNVTVCSLTASTPYNVYVAARNRVISGINTSTAFSTLAASAQPQETQGCIVSERISDTAGVINIIQPAVEIGFDWALGFWTLVLAVAFLLSTPLSPFRYTVFHSTLHRLPNRQWKWARWFLWEFFTASPGYFITFTALLLGLCAAYGGAYQWFSLELYAWGQQFTAERSAGYVLSISLGAQLMPVTRNSVWLHVFGVPFERALRLRRWLGFVTFILTLWHGLGMLIKFNDTPLGSQYNLLVRKGTAADTVIT
jgi:hypothetical protein